MVSSANRIISFAEYGSRSHTPDILGHSVAAESSSRSPLRGFPCSSPAASLPPPPSPTCKGEESSLSSDEVPLRLMAHPVSDGEESHATPMMICNFLQLTLNEPPSSTKVAAETDFTALAKQQLFVSELPTPTTQADGTPGPSLGPGVSLQACTSGRQQQNESRMCRSSASQNLSPLKRASQQAMQQCGGLASPQLFRSSVDRLALVDAATSPAPPLCAQASETVSVAESSKAASEQAAVELCQSPVRGPAASPWSCTPVCLRASAGVECNEAGDMRAAEGIQLTPLDGACTHVSAGSPGFNSMPEVVAPVAEAAGTPKLQAMGNALSPLLRDACGRSAKSVLRDLLADLVEQERALDAQASAVKTATWKCPELTTAEPPAACDDDEETVNVIPGSPVLRDVSLPAEMNIQATDCANSGSGLDIVDPLTFDAVYDDAVQLHLAAGLGDTQAQADLTGRLESQVDALNDALHACPGIHEAAQAVPKAGRSMLLQQDQPVSPAMTRVSTFSVRSALSSDVGPGVRLTGSASDVAAWLCPSEPISQGGDGTSRTQRKTKSGPTAARRAVAMGCSAPGHPRSSWTSATSAKIPAHAGVFCIQYCVAPSGGCSWTRQYGWYVLLYGPVLYAIMEVQGQGSRSPTGAV